MLRPPSLAANLALFAGAVCLVDGLVFGLGVPSSSPGHAGDPPGWLVGSVWVLLFLSFGTAHWLLRDERLAGARLGVEALALLCLAYPFYTLGLARSDIGLVGNILTAVAAAILVGWLWRARRSAAGFIFPVIPWLAYATFTMIQA